MIPLIDTDLLSSCCVISQEQKPRCQARISRWIVFWGSLFFVYIDTLTIPLECGASYFIEHLIYNITVKYFWSCRVQQQRTDMEGMAPGMTRSSWMLEYTMVNGVSIFLLLYYSYRPVQTYLVLSVRESVTSSKGGAKARVLSIQQRPWQKKCHVSLALLCFAYCLSYAS